MSPWYTRQDRDRDHDSVRVRAFALEALEQFVRLNDERPDPVLRHPAQVPALRAVISALPWIMPLTRIGINLEPRIRRRHFPFFAILVESGN